MHQTPARPVWWPIGSSTIDSRLLVFSVFVCFFLCSPSCLLFIPVSFWSATIQEGSSILRSDVTGQTNEQSLHVICQFWSEKSPSLFVSSRVLSLCLLFIPLSFWSATIQEGSSILRSDVTGQTNEQSLHVICQFWSEKLQLRNW